MDMPNHNATATSSLTVIVDGVILYENNGSWLHPLFDLEDFLASSPADTANAEIRDKIIGKAAAFLIVRIGAERVHGGIMSKPAVGVFEDARIPYSYEELVDQIDCKTEEILANVTETDQAYDILRSRAGR